jgi:hypothetical protein
MLRGNAVDRGSGDLNRFAPIEFVGRTSFSGFQVPADAEGSDELRLPPSSEPPQGGQIQVIVVIVAQQNDVDARKILPLNAWRSAAARTHPQQRACPFRPDRIRQDVDVFLLEQDGGMVDQRNRQFAMLNKGGRF